MYPKLISTSIEIRGNVAVNFMGVSLRIRDQDLWTSAGVWEKFPFLSINLAALEE